MHAVVIGAGVIGSSIALQLKRLGHDVTVIDRNSAAGMGSTSASSAVVRFNYSTFDAVALSWESYFLWKEFKELIDGTNGYSSNSLSNSQDLAHLKSPLLPHHLKDRSLYNLIVRPGVRDWHLLPQRSAMGIQQLMLA